MSELAAITAVLLVVYAVLGYKLPALAMATVPIVALGMVYFFIESAEMEVALSAVVLFLVTLVAVALGGRHAETQRWYQRLAFLILAAVGGLLFIVGFFWAFAAVGAGFVLPLFLLLGVAAVVACLIGYSAGSRKTTAASVFSTLGSSMRQNLPLPMALECAAHGRTDGTARTLQQIKKWLLQGYSLVESLRRGYPRCPSRALAILAAAEPQDQLPAAMATVEADLRSQATGRMRLQPVHAAYPLVILTITFIMVLGLMTFVVPQFKAVLEEMTGARLPAPTRVLIGIMEVLVYEHNGLPAILLFVLIFFVIPPVWIWARTRRRRPEKPYLFSRMGDWIKWRLPVLHWFENNSATLQTVELMRISLRTDCPLNEAIRGTLDLDVNQSFKRRLACWLRRVEQGDDVAAAARGCGLPSGLAWAFERSAGASHAPAVLEMLESFYRFNYSYRVNLARFIFWPCAIILLGATVGFVVFAVFSPGVQVINSMAGNVYP
jgi:type II secretory pathway component PulF